MRKRFIYHFLFIFIFFNAASANLNIDHEDSIMFGNKENRKRIFYDPTFPPITTQWQVQLAPAGKPGEPPILGQPVILSQEQNIYIKAGQEILALDLNSGQLLQRKQIETTATFPSISSPTYRQGRLFFGTRANGIYALSSNLAQTIWHLPLESKVSSSPLLVDNLVILGATDQHTYILDQHQGTQAGNSPIPQQGEITSSPCLFGNAFAIGVDGTALNGSVQAYDLQGNRLWSYSTKTGVPASIATDGNYLYFFDKKGRFYALNARTGRRQWMNESFFKPANFINNSPALYQNRLYFVINQYNGQKARVVCLNSTNGLPLAGWLQRDLAADSWVSPIIWSAANLLLVADDSGTVYGLDLTTGQERPWYYDRQQGKTVSRVNLGAPVTGEMALAGGYLLVATLDGKLHAFGNQGLQNLMVSGLTSSSQEIEKGKTNQTRLLVSARDVSRPLITKLELKLDGQTVASQNLTISPGDGRPWQERGRTVEVEIHWQVPANLPEKDSYTLTAIVNGDRQAHWLNQNQPFVETTYADNTTSLKLNGSLVNLRMLSLSYPSPISPGQSYQGTVQVENQGSRPLSTTLKLTLNQRQVALLPVTLVAKEKKAVSFAIKAPDTTGSFNLTAWINPDRQIKEKNYQDNSLSKAIQVRQEVREEQGQLTVSGRAEPAQIKAGQVFALVVETATTPYTWEETVYEQQPDGSVVEKKVRRSRPCPGAKYVQVRFPDGQQVLLEPTNPAGTPANTWQLPVNPRSKNRARIHFTDPYLPDGLYPVTIIAAGAGDDGNLSARTVIKVVIKGSILEGIKSRLTY
ncbi:Outer membrane protein assembly factor BamB [Carboxydocella thermautotrophica]|nr:Outer membrane protein assembly factor BamB [Carboxydocella thermautotrophica]